MRTRVLIITAAALAVVGGSGCMSFDGGALVNRCGIFQLLTGRPLLLSVGDVASRVAEADPPPAVATIKDQSGNGADLSAVNSGTTWAVTSGSSAVSVAGGGGGGSVNAYVTNSNPNGDGGYSCQIMASPCEVYSCTVSSSSSSTIYYYSNSSGTWTAMSPMPPSQVCAMTGTAAR